jgi:hypothetical protein
MNRFHLQGPRHGLTRIEVLVVIAIFLVLFAMLPPIIWKVREASARIQCNNNVKQLSVAVANYAGTYSNQLPPSTPAKPVITHSSPDGIEPSTIGLNFMLFPFVGQANRLNTLTSNTAGIDDGVAYTFGTRPMKDFICPSDSSISNGLTNNLAASCYAHNLCLFGTPGGAAGDAAAPGPKYQPQFTIANVPDGTSNTISFAERLANCNGTYVYRDTSSFTSTTNASVFAIYPWDNGGYRVHKDSVPLPQIGVTSANCVFNNNANGGATGTAARETSTGHTGGMIVGMLDGSVRTVSSAVSADNWTRAVWPADTEIPSGSWP